jgi:GAF domain-containing protein
VDTRHRLRRECATRQSVRQGSSTTDQRRFGERDAEDPGRQELRLGAAEIVRAQAAVDDLSRAHSFHHCALFVWDPAVRRLRLAAQHWGAGEDLGEVRAGHWTIALSGICGRAFSSRRPILVGDVEDDPAYLKFPGSRTRSELAIPVIVDGQPLGVINIESPRLQAYGAADLAAVEARAGALAELIRSFYVGRA